MSIYKKYDPYAKPQFSSNPFAPGEMVPVTDFHPSDYSFENGDPHKKGIAAHKILRKQVNAAITMPYISHDISNVKLHEHVDHARRQMVMQLSAEIVREVSQSEETWNDEKEKLKDKLDHIKGRLEKAKEVYDDREKKIRSLIKANKKLKKELKARLEKDELTEGTAIFSKPYHPPNIDYNNLKELADAWGKIPEREAYKRSQEAIEILKESLLRKLEQEEFLSGKKINKTDPTLDPKQEVNKPKGEQK